jgi:hypothetical protein
MSTQGPLQQARFSERKEYQRMPPPSLHDRSRTEPETPHPRNTLPQITILHATRSNSPTPQTSAASNLKEAAQLALLYSDSRPRT